MRAPLLAGAVLIAATVGMTWFIMTTSKDRYDEDSTYVVAADFPDASGLRWKTRVQINGIDVGKIEDVLHVPSEHGRLTARVRLRILDEYDLYANAKLRKASESLLGDYRLDLDPGGPQDACSDFQACPAGFDCQQNICIRACGGPSDCPSPMGCVSGVCIYPKIPKDGTGVIGDVQSRSDMDEITDQLRVVARNVARVTDSLANVLGGPEGEGSIRNIVDSLERSMASIDDASRILASTLDRNDEQVDRIIDNLQTVSHEIARSMAAGGEIKTAAENIASLTGRLDQIAASIEAMMDDTDGREASIQDTVEELNRTMNHLASITRKIDEGEGTVGALINEREIVDNVEQAVEDVGELIGGLARLQTEIEWRSQYEIPLAGENQLIEAAVKNILALRIKPKPDKYYLLEVVSDPRGRSTRSIQTEVTQVGDAPQGPPVTTETTTISYDDLKFSAQFAKRFYFLTLRFGILENTGGVGANLHFFDDDLELRLDAFDFTRRDTQQGKILPRLRFSASYEFFDHVGLQLGFDDPLNETLRTVFFGGVLRFTDEDLKMLLAVAPTP